MLNRYEHKKLYSQIKETLPPCLECSACCRRGWMVEVTKEEALKMPNPKELLRLNKIEQEEFDTDPLYTTYQMNYVDGACIALNKKTNKCTIYNVRPKVCRGVKRGDKWCAVAFIQDYPFKTRSPSKNIRW